MQAEYYIESDIPYVEVVPRYFALALELGKTTEGSAMAFVERVDKGSSAPRFELRGLSRFPPGTQYTAMIADVVKLVGPGEVGQELGKVKKTQLPGGGVRREDPRLFLVLDQTTAGKPIVDMFLQKINRPHAQQVIFAGNHMERDSDGVLYIPKQQLISEIEVLLAEERLKFSNTHPLTADLVKELTNYQNKTSAHATSVNDPWREQPGDDLVFAVGLACRRLKTTPFLKWDTL